MASVDQETHSERSWNSEPGNSPVHSVDVSAPAASAAATGEGGTDGRAPAGSAEDKARVDAMVGGMTAKLGDAGVSALASAHLPRGRRAMPRRHTRAAGPTADAARRTPQTQHAGCKALRVLGSESAESRAIAAGAGGCEVTPWTLPPLAPVAH